MHQLTVAKCRYGSKASFVTQSRHVRYYPQSDHDSDMLGGRFVPKRTSAPQQIV